MVTPSSSALDPSRTLQINRLEVSPSAPAGVSTQSTSITPASMCPRIRNLVYKIAEAVRAFFISIAQKLQSLFGAHPSSLRMPDNQPLRASAIIPPVDARSEATKRADAILDSEPSPTNAHFAENFYRNHSAAEMKDEVQKLTPSQQKKLVLYAINIRKKNAITRHGGDHRKSVEILTYYRTEVLEKTSDHARAEQEKRALKDLIAIGWSKVRGEPPAPIVASLKGALGISL